ncbi:MAG: hypothetical protein ACR2PH_13750 [Desulfobulbia bacterium]
MRIITLSMALAAASIFGVPAEAAIKCKDSYQIIKGQGEIATPYCGDKWLSQISGVPFKTLRNNPTERRRVCQMYGGDPKVQSVCGIDADRLRPSF